MKKIREWRDLIRSGTLPRRRRWQLLGAVVAFYLVRDLLLYVILPVFIWMKAR